MAGATQRLLTSVARRQHWRGIGAWSFRLLLALAAVYLLMLLTARLLALMPDWFDLVTVLAVPLAAGAIALLIARRPAPQRAARLADARLNTKDLFLTSVELDHAPGEYRPVVEHQAADRAAAARPAQVVPLNWWPPAWRGGIVMAGLLAATLWVPQYDPFGRFEERQKVVERQRELEEQKKLAVQKIEALQAKPLDEPVSENVQIALNDLKQTFDQTKPDQPKTNLARLNDQQKEIGQQWRKAMEQNLKRSSSDLAQQFGSSDSQQSQQWRKQMEEGKADGVKKAIQEARDAAKKLAQTKDPAKQQEARAALQEKLQQLSDFANSSARSSQLDAAMQQAMKQLQLAAMEGLEGDALDALESTLELSELQAEELAQQLRDMKELEKALQAIQLAKQLNDGQGLNGEACKQCNGMAQYVEHYKKMMGTGDGQGVCSHCNGQGCSACAGTGKGSAQAQGQGQGQGGGQGGMGGPGQGRGGKAPEDPSAVTDFTPDQARSQISAGRMLLQWKTNEAAEAGEAKRQYADAVQQVKQGVSEAILQEQVPPGYHDAIREYFDTLAPGNVAPGTPAPGSAAPATSGGPRPQ